MSSYKINYKQFRQQPEISEMLSALERGFEKFGIDFYLVGAVARDVWMLGINNIAPRRTTGDIDFAVLINDKGVYEKLKVYLEETEGFQSTHGNTFVLIWKDKTEVDLMPFGAIEDVDGKVKVEGTGFTTLSVPGFKEVYEDGLPELELEDEHKFKFCTLPGIVILKLIAWDDRSEVRRSDIIDISDILNHFYDMDIENIWQNHSDLYSEENKEMPEIQIASRVMGREMAKIAKRNEKLFMRLDGILTLNTKNLANSPMADIMAAFNQNMVEENVLLLENLLQGFREENNK